MLHDWLQQCIELAKEDIEDVVQWLTKLEVRLEACQMVYHKTVQ